MHRVPGPRCNPVPPRYPGDTEAIESTGLDIATVPTLMHGATGSTFPEQEELCGAEHATFDIFLSHKQSNGQDAVATLKMLLLEREESLACWLDLEQNPTMEGMHSGVKHSKHFLLFCTEGIFESKWCLMEIRWALQYALPIILVVETDTRHGAVAMEELIKSAPEDIRGLFASSVAIPWYRDPDFRGVSVGKIMERLAIRQEGRGLVVISDGDNRVEIVHRYFRRFMLLAGAPLRLPPSWSTAAKVAYWIAQWSSRVPCLFICIARTWHGSGPAYTEAHSDIIFILVHLEVIFCSLYLSRLMMSPSLMALLEGLGKNDVCDKLGSALCARTKASALAALGSTLPPGILLALHLPLHFHSFYTGHAAEMDDAIVGWLSGIAFLGLLVVPGFISLQGLLPFQMDFLVRVATIQLEGSLLSLHPGQSLEQAKAVKEMKGEQILRFNKEWEDGMHQYRQMQQRLIPLQIPLLCVALGGMSLPASLLVRGIPIANPEQKDMLFFYFVKLLVPYVLGLVCFKALIGLPLETTFRLRSLRLQYLRMTWTTLSHQSFFRQVLSGTDTDCYLFSVVPANTWVAFAGVALVLSSAYPLTRPELWA